MNVFSMQRSQRLILLIITVVAVVILYAGYSRCVAKLFFLKIVAIIMICDEQ